MTGVSEKKEASTAWGRVVTGVTEQRDASTAGGRRESRGPTAVPPLCTDKRGVRRLATLRCLGVCVGGCWCGWVSVGGGGYR